MVNTKIDGGELTEDCEDHNEEEDQVAGEDGHGRHADDHGKRQPIDCATDSHHLHHHLPINTGAGDVIVTLQPIMCQTGTRCSAALFNQIFEHFT